MNNAIRYLILSIILVVSAIAQQKSAFPNHWGTPPEIETMDILKLPAEFGEGSSTRKHWIIERMTEDIRTNHPERVVNTNGPWPEFVGMKGSDAKHLLWLDAGLAEIVVLKVGTPVTRDYRVHRVRIYVGEDGLVAKVPNKG